MPLKVVGGFVVTFEEIEQVADCMGLEFRQLGSARIVINNWIAEHEPKLWPFRLQHIDLKESGEVVPKLIFPTMATKTPQDPNFRYSETDGNTAKVRETARKLGMPDKLFHNFMTVFNPEIHFIRVPCPRPTALLESVGDLQLTGTTK
ncbi:hypothetical protein BDV93DRAFT_559875 [Ceratobasidium sp. AG-I]|nr:hypothetical protein BDV93DRAFT_559875 [Ceratobasidium sp. AG-I]